jgi:hypothetical protein
MRHVGRHQDNTLTTLLPRQTEALLVAVIALLAIIETGCSKPAKTNTVPAIAPRLSAQAADAEFVARLRAIEAELNGLGAHEWAGVYWGPRLKMAVVPQSGVVVLLFGSLGECPLNHGDIVDVTDERIVIGWANPHHPEEFYLAHEFLRTRVGSREYLLTEAQLPQFRRLTDAGFLGDGSAIIPVQFWERARSTTH